MKTIRPHLILMPLVLLISLTGCGNDVDRAFGILENADQVKNSDEEKQSDGDSLGVSPEILSLEFKAPTKAKYGTKVFCEVSVSDADSDLSSIKVSLVVMSDPTDIDSDILDEFQIFETDQESASVSFTATKDMAEYTQAGYRISCLAEVEDSKGNQAALLSDNVMGVVSPTACKLSIRSFVANQNREASVVTPIGEPSLSAVYCAQAADSVVKAIQP